MRRLYLQIYLSLIGILVLFGILASIAWLIASPNLEQVRLFDAGGALLEDYLPGPDQPVDELQEALEKIAKHIPVHLNVRDRDGRLLAVVGETLPAPSSYRTTSGWIRSRGQGATVAFHLPDGRWLVARHSHSDRQTHAFGALTILGLLAVAVGIGAYPVVRRLTRRLERLQSRVDALAAGDLSTRIEVEGNDEIASLARSFNRAAPDCPPSRRRSAVFSSRRRRYLLRGDSRHQIVSGFKSPVRPLNPESPETRYQPSAGSRRRSGEGRPVPASSCLARSPPRDRLPGPTACLPQRE